MKTAMQELIERLKRNIKEMPNEKNQFTQGYKAGLSFVIECATNSLEKEKEQIIEACNANLKGLLATGKDYYDLNFNHHIEVQSSSYTNFKPDNANAVAEYNNSLTNFSQPKQITN